METNPKQAFGPVISRLSDLMIHTKLYSSKGNARLAEEVGTDPNTISRFIHGKLTNPSFVLVARITDALEKEIGYRIDPRDLFAEMGKFLTRHVCELMRCSGCLPPVAHNSNGEIKREFALITQGKWVSSRFPNGYSSVNPPHDNR